MCTEKGDSIIKDSLESLCCSNGWSYGVFWGFDKRNSLLLTLQDAYYGEQMGAVIGDMLLQVHVVGGGLIGKSAFNKNHQWINSLESVGSLQDSEFYCQFATGIKTIVVISVEPFGVVQFGSTQKIPETKEFVDRVKESFRGISKDQKFILSENETSSSEYANPSALDMNTIDSSTCSLFEEEIQLQQLLLESPTCFDFSIQEPSSVSGDSVVLTSSSYDLRSFKSNVSSSSFEELFPTNDFTTVASSVDEISQWFSPPPDQGITSSAMELCNSLSHAAGLIPVAEYNSSNCPTNSLQSSITDAFNYHGKKKMSGVDELFYSFKEDPAKPIVHSDTSECTSVKRSGSKIGTNNSLFSELGLDHLFYGIASSSSSVSIPTFEDKASSNAKRRKIENYAECQHQMKFQGLPSSFDRKMKWLNPVYNPGKTIILEPKTGTSTKEADSWTGDDSTMNTGNSCSPMRNEQVLVQTLKKKAKPGTRPRPKDRQRFQDRLAELRKLIPNGEKMSIDCLLERTIGHLNFMPSLTRHVQSVKLTHKPKNDNSSSSSGGVTWACEVGDQTMVCPLVVEDLSTPGQMLVEILFEEQGSILEIADKIRGFGLTILKAVMEIRETKLWAHFIVEAEGNRHVTRHEVFPSLIQLLQIMSPTGANASDGYDSITESEAFLFENHQPDVSLPVNLADTF